MFRVVLTGDGSIGRKIVEALDSLVIPGINITTLGIWCGLESREMLTISVTDRSKVLSYFSMLGAIQTKLVIFRNEHVGMWIVDLSNPCLRVTN